MYFSNSHERRDLPMPGDPGDRDQLGLPLFGRRVEELLDEPQLAIAADERRFEPRRAEGAHAGPP